MSVNGHGPVKPDFEPKKPKHRQLLGGDLLGQALRHVGVDYAFGVHGGHLDAFLAGAAEAGIKLVDTRHEATSVNAAEAYAKFTGQVGVSFVTANSGFGNGLAGLMTAFADQSPIFVITSSCPLRDADTNVLQAIHDQVVVAKPMTKWAYRCTNPEEIPRIVAHGFREAIAGKAGPVLVDFPIDVLFTPVDTRRIAYGALNRPLPRPAAPHPDSIKEVVAILKAAKRPAIITGNQANFKEVGPLLLKLAESQHIPVFNSPEIVAQFPVDHNLYGGVAHMLGVLESVGKEKVDAVIILGTRTGMFLGNRAESILHKDCKVIQVNTDGGELGRSTAVDLGVVSGSEQFLLALLAAIGSDKLSVDREWVDFATSIRKGPSPHDSDPEYIDGSPHPHHAIKKFVQSLDPDYILIQDGGEVGQWLNGFAPTFSKPYAMVHSTGYLGFLGNGFGYALGAAFAHPDKKIVFFTGDGAAGFHIAELDTYVRMANNILFVVGNNSVWGMSINGQDELYGPDNTLRVASTLRPETSWAKVAEGFGLPSATIDKLEDIEPTVRRLAKIQGPAAIDLRVASKPTHIGTKMAVQNTDDENLIVVPYYENLPRPFYK